MHWKAVIPVDKTGNIQEINTRGIKQAISMRFVLTLLAFIVTIPIAYTISYNFEIPIYRLIASNLISVLVIFFVDFRNSSKAAIRRFLLRLSLAFITGFVVFLGETILINIAVAVYTLVLMSVLSYGLSDDYQKLSILPATSFVFNFVTGVLLRVNAEFSGIGPLHSIFLIISTVAVFTYFMLLHIDTARIFGNDNMKIPASMSRAILLILIVVSLFILIFTLLPWIQNIIVALITGIAGLLARLIRFIFTSLQRDYQPFPDDYIPGNFDSFPLFSDEDIIYEQSEISPVVMWVFFGLLLLILSVLIIFALTKLILFLVKLLKSKHQRVVMDGEVFTETIERIKSSRKKRIKRNRTKRPRYASLQTESERIKFIYNEYVRRAKRNGLTQNANNDTPNEILGEVVRSIQDSQEKRDKSFPLPGNLGDAFNAVRYGDCNGSSLEIKAFELKKKVT
jgi:hypothetical protein